MLNLSWLNMQTTNTVLWGADSSVDKSFKLHLYKSAHCAKQSVISLGELLCKILQH